MFLFKILRYFMVFNFLFAILRGLVQAVPYLLIFPIPWLVLTKDRVGHFATNRRFWFWGPYIDAFRWIISFLLVPAGVFLVWVSYTRILPGVWDTGEFNWVQLGLWAGVSLVAGCCFIPLRVVWLRHRIYREHVWDKHPNAAHDRNVAHAIHRGNNARIAFEDGYAITADNGIRPISKSARLAPEYEGDMCVIGRVNRPLRGLGVKAKDKNIVQGWVDGKDVVIPHRLSQTRVICIAQSGSGKTDLLVSVAAAYAHRGVKVSFVDWKADSKDAAHFATVLGTQVTDTRYRVFDGSVREVVDERLFGIVYPSSGGDGDYYRSASIRYARDVLSYGGPVQSLSELIDRMRVPLLYMPQDAQLRSTYGNEKENRRVANDTYDRLQVIEPFITEAPNQGWSWWDNTGSRVLPMAPEDGQKKIGVMMLRDLKRYIMDYRARKNRGEVLGEELIIIDEFPQMVSEDSDPASEAAGLFELVRSAEGIGLIIATQTPEGLSADEPMQRRLMASGATLFAGRSSNPRLVSELSGVVESETKDMDADVAATGTRFVAPNVAPEWVRTASMGEFAIIQSGAYEWVRIWRADDSPAVEPVNTAAQQTDTVASGEEIMVGERGGFF